MSKNFGAGMHSVIYKQIRFKLGLIDSAKLYMLILVKVTVTLIQGHRVVGKQKPLGQLSLKFSMNCDGIWYALETC